MRIIKASEITKKVKSLCICANYNLPGDVELALKNAKESETSPLGREILADILENACIAKKNSIPICQDTGMAVLFVEIGNKAYVDGNIEKAINEGVSLGYKEGFLRASVVADPLCRTNTGDNTPAVVHYSFTEGNSISITMVPKGFGSENMSAVKMLTPADGREGVINFIVQTVKQAGSNPCPPIVLGVGIGGTMEKAAILAKKALTLNVGEKNADEYYAKIEQEVLEKVNSLNIGVQGFSGSTTALGVNIIPYPTHIAGLPVAVNISCHVTRHKTIII